MGVAEVLGDCRSNVGVESIIAACWLLDFTVGRTTWNHRGQILHSHIWPPPLQRIGTRGNLIHGSTCFCVRPRSSRLAFSGRADPRPLWANMLEHAEQRGQSTETRAVVRVSSLCLTCERWWPVELTFVHVRQSTQANMKPASELKAGRASGGASDKQPQESSGSTKHCIQAKRHICEGNKDVYQLLI